MKNKLIRWSLNPFSFFYPLSAIRYSLISAVCVLLAVGFSYAADQSAANDAAVEQAKRDYRIFLEQLKALNSQYKEITSEIKEVIKEEGVPAFDEETGEMAIVKPDEDFGSDDVSIKETDKEMTVRVDLPGVKKEEIKVRIENNKVLRIFGQRDSARQRGRFQRRIELPSEARDSGIEAKYENGVLTVTIPKTASKKSEIVVPIR